MTEKPFTVILKCEQKGNTQECEYYVEMEGIETSLRDILYQNEQLKKQRYDLYMDIARLVKENEQLEKDCIALINDKKELKEENEQLRKDNEEFKDVIIDKVQYGEDNLEEFLIKKGIISEDWARFDDYD